MLAEGPPGATGTSTGLLASGRPSDRVLLAELMLGIVLAAPDDAHSAGDFHDDAWLAVDPWAWARDDSGGAATPWFVTAIGFVFLLGCRGGSCPGAVARGWFGVDGLLPIVGSERAAFSSVGGGRTLGRELWWVVVRLPMPMAGPTNPFPPLSPPVASGTERSGRGALKRCLRLKGR